MNTRLKGNIVIKVNGITRNISTDPKDLGKVTPDEYTLLDRGVKKTSDMISKRYKGKPLDANTAEDIRTIYAGVTRLHFKHITVSLEYTSAGKKVQINDWDRH